MAQRRQETSGRNPSIWLTGRGARARPALNADATADVCVVGAGVAGLSTAYLLAREGQRVVVLEDGTVGSGETGRSTAHLATAQDDRFTELERLHGQERVRLLVHAHGQAIGLVETLVQALEVDCGFRRLSGYLCAAPGTAASTLERELAAAQRAGLPDAVLHAAPPLAELGAGPCVEFPRQAQVNPLVYVQALAAAVERLHGHVHQHTHATRILGGTQAVVETAGGARVRAQAVVVATNAPVVSRVVIPLKQSAYRTYVVALQVPKGVIPPALYWDTADPYHYVRLQPGTPRGRTETLLVGGEDHKTGQDGHPEERFTRLESWARHHFPQVGKVVAQWSGQVMEPADGIAYIGRNPGDADNVFIATGDSGQGMTHGTIAGMLLTDLVLGRSNPWEALFDPARMRLGAAWELAREKLNEARQYGRWFSAGEGPELSALAPGHGTVVREGVEPLACHRRADGTLCCRSAVCPHLGSVVGWNPVEGTWDCPAHGSRFTAEGAVINGPANADLAEPGSAPQEAPPRRPRPRPRAGARR